jgi:FHS family L-fucose permease-like MFS transporter
MGAISNHSQAILKITFFNYDQHTMSQNTKTNYNLPFILVTSLFFLWGIANSLNGTLIKHFQTALDLNRAQAGIVDSAFYIGYFVMAIPAGLFMRRFGYKYGILIGLSLYILGALLFYPAANARSYGFFLFNLFTIASGLAFLETAANLYMTVLGDPAKGANRLNFAQSFNGLSIILGPIIGGLFIFSTVEYSREQLAAMPFQQAEAVRIAEAHSVQMPYLVIAGVVLLVTLLFAFTKMPEVGTEESVENSPNTSSFLSLLKIPRLTFGIIAQFFYVGAQASLWGYFVDFKLELARDQHVGLVNSIYQVSAGMSPTQIASFHASAALALFMIGRFFGTWLMSRISPQRVLAIFAAFSIVLILAVMNTGGLFAVVCLMLVYFFMSIMFPTIFALATQGLGSRSKMASSLVIMAIVGGAVLPPLTGLLFKSGVAMALTIPLVAFIYILFYAVRGSRYTAEAAN